MRRAPLAVAILALASPAPAAGEVRLHLIPSLTVEGGYDSNLFLDTRLLKPNEPVPASDAVVRVAPRLVAGLSGRRAQLLLDYDLMARLSLSHGQAFDHFARVSLAVTVAPVRIEASGIGELYDLLCPTTDLACHSADSFLLGGGELALRVAPVSGNVTAGASYRLDARTYPDRVQVDFGQRATAFLHLRRAVGPVTLAAGARAGYFNISSSMSGADLDRVRGDLDASFAIKRLTVEGGYGLAWQRLPSPIDGGGPRVDLLHHGWFVVAVRLFPWLELFVSGDVLSSVSSRESGTWDRLQLFGGLSARYRVETLVPRPPPPLPPEQSGRQIHFRLRAAPGAEVALVGEWNAWSPIPLLPVGPGLYEVSVDLPPGRYRYSFTVAGQPVRPPDAHAYAPDGFGGSDGVIVVQ